ncbi:hypothetical protein NHX12_034375 [Muraenolepis orangiensis]|uniref:Uncharacterized protein n=1 Tax=Muraenolepis orangiensis TaxID=630683 RepID=A0A9Q0D5F7_9TELE|nr:hypothetical protein NHX12_034375 [Muraenolepis orangiensis]
MFGGRGGGGKGGKFSVEDLYGFSKKPKKVVSSSSSSSTEAATSSSGATPANAGARSQARGHGQRRESEALASQILEAANKLVERRRLELYLRECCLSLADSEAERTTMTYR